MFGNAGQAYQTRVQNQHPVWYSPVTPSGCLTPILGAPCFIDTSHSGPRANDLTSRQSSKWLTAGAPEGWGEGMSRPLRVAVVDGWYHVTAPAPGRQRVFHDHRDYEHLLGTAG